MNTKIERAKKLIALLKDGELTEEERAAVEEGIKLNPELEGELKGYDRLEEILAGARSVELTASPLLEERIAESLKSDGEEKKRLRTLKEFLFASRKYTFEVVGAAAVGVLLLFALFRFMPGFTATKNIAANGELKIGKTFHTAPAETDDSSIKGFASSPESTTTEETDEDKALGPFPIHEEPEDVTLPLAKDRVIAEAPGTAVTPDMEKRDSLDDRVAVRSAVKGRKSEDMPGGVKGRGTGGEGKVKMRTLIFTATDESGHPINLIIYTDNPDRVRYDIENKAMELSAEYRDEKDEEGSYVLKEKKEKNITLYEIKRSSRNVHIPRERVRELLTYIESQYPPTKSQIKELDIDEKKSLLNIEFEMPNGEE
jgi:hypothetical protein